MMNEIERVQNLYAVTANRQLGNNPESMWVRVNIIRELERITKQSFNSTADFHSKINAWIIKKQAEQKSAGK
jgi:hypothetical protein